MSHSKQPSSAGARCTTTTQQFYSTLPAPSAFSRSRMDALYALAQIMPAWATFRRTIRWELRHYSEAGVRLRMPPRHALLHGDPRMHRRPALALTVGLASLGAKVLHLARQGSMPTAIGPTGHLKNFAPPNAADVRVQSVRYAAVLASHGIAHKDASIACGRLTSSRM